MNKKEILLEVWKTRMYCHEIGEILVVPTLILLWFLGYKVVFWIMLVMWIIALIILCSERNKMEEENIEYVAITRAKRELYRVRQ